MKKPAWFATWASEPIRDEVVMGREVGSHRARVMKRHRLSGEWMHLIASDWIGCHAPEKWRRVVSKPDGHTTEDAG